MTQQTTTDPTTEPEEMDEGWPCGEGMCQCGCDYGHACGCDCSRCDECMQKPDYCECGD
ncbi:hypothetical protein ACFV9E_06270 [Streptomyces sp. NPDC059835]|uniref:hypothetical protein n=1 Tax=Streptomyces sp. NPDC059835 TaxID=3346967 RepID=UPI00365C77D8